MRLKQYHRDNKINRPIKEGRKSRNQHKHGDLCVCVCVWVCVCVCWLPSIPHVLQDRNWGRADLPSRQQGHQHVILCSGGFWSSRSDGMVQGPASYLWRSWWCRGDVNNPGEENACDGSVTGSVLPRLFPQQLLSKCCSNQTVPTEVLGCFLLLPFFGSHQFPEPGFSFSHKCVSYLVSFPQILICVNYLELVSISRN